MVVTIDRWWLEDVPRGWAPDGSVPTFRRWKRREGVALDTDRQESVSFANAKMHKNNEYLLKQPHFSSTCSYVDHQLCIFIGMSNASLNLSID